MNRLTTNTLWILTVCKRVLTPNPELYCTVSNTCVTFGFLLSYDYQLVFSFLFVSCYSGVHHKGKNCNPAEKVKQIETILSANQKYLFPDNLQVHGYPKVPNKATKPNGGWGDTRDHNLCLLFGEESTHQR